MTIWAAVLAVLAVGLYACSGAKSDTVQAKRPIIGLMSSLPLQWQEGDIGDVIGSKGIASPAFDKLSVNFDLRSMDNLSPKNLNGISALMMAQSRGLSPSEFANLDDWVRGGGKLLLLADPALHWESIYPLGDKRRPLFTSLLSPLFAHWGLELVLPVDDGDEKYQTFVLDDQAIRTVTAGAWQAVPGGEAECVISDKQIVAKCTVGKGYAILVADADLMDGNLWQGSGVRGLFGSDDFANIAWIDAQLAKLTAK